eukprot:scaffold232453_cov31-Tisochrysis_lutea.AAC.4
MCNQSTVDARALADNRIDSARETNQRKLVSRLISFESSPRKAFLSSWLTSSLTWCLGVAFECCVSRMQKPGHAHLPSLLSLAWRQITPSCSALCLAGWTLPLALFPHRKAAFLLAGNGKDD